MLFFLSSKIKLSSFCSFYLRLPIILFSRVFRKITLFFFFFFTEKFNNSSRYFLQRSFTRGKCLWLHFVLQGPLFLRMPRSNNYLSVNGSDGLFKDKNSLRNSLNVHDYYNLELRITLSIRFVSCHVQLGAVPHDTHATCNICSRFCCFYVNKIFASCLVGKSSTKLWERDRLSSSIWCFVRCIFHRTIIYSSSCFSLSLCRFICVLLYAFLRCNKKSLCTALDHYRFNRRDIMDSIKSCTVFWHNEKIFLSCFFTKSKTKRTCSPCGASLDKRLLYVMYIFRINPRSYAIRKSSPLFNCKNYLKNPILCVSKISVRYLMYK